MRAPFLRRTSGFRPLLDLHVAVALALLLAPAAVAQSPSAQEPGSAPETRALTIEEYRQWRTISDEALSSDGAWVTWGYRQLLRDDVLHVTELDGDGDFQVPRADRAQFSDDARWIGYRISPTLAEIQRLERQRGPVRRQIQVRPLREGDGETRTWENATSFQFAPGGGHVLVTKARAEGWPQGRGDDLILRDLEAGTEALLGAVSEHAFNEDGSVLAFVTATEDREGNGLHLIHLETGVRQVLDSRPQRYERLTWSDDGTALAALRGETPDGQLQRENVLLVFTAVGPGDPVRLVFDPARAADFPDAMVVSEFAGLSFSDGADQVFFGIREQEGEADEAPTGVERPDVHVFHWNDDRIQTVQQVQANADRRRTYRAVVHLPSMDFVQLADESVASVSVTADGRWAVGSDDRAYISDWKEPQADYYRIDVATGERTPIVMEQGRTLGLSPHSTHFIYWRDAHVWAYELDSGETTNLTASAPVSFVDVEFNRVGTPPPYGVAGWTEDGRAVVLEHLHDLWLQPLDGGPATNLTGGFGDEQQVRLRVQRLDASERTLDLSRPLLLRAFGTWTKVSGYFRLPAGGGTPQELVYEDRWYSTPSRAADAERLLFTRETFREFPDLHVSDLDFGAVRKVTDANPQQAEYRWGERILFDFEGPDGVTLQGTLAIPDGYQPGERLPMLVNFYEQNSQNLHRYQSPSHVHRPNFSGYVSRGYLVMQPDIHFRTRTTHTDMLESVEGAVRKVIEMGYADPERVGLNGHSFSGGGSAYIAGRSDMFAAIVAGAAPINLRSEFNVLFRGSGQNNHRYDIHGQGRYGTDPYTDLELYLDQSPITHVPTIDTPMIYLHGEDDMVVEYLQGMELYNAARFLGKPVIFLSYPGEGHGLSRLENRLDFQIRIGQFYGHYLKGEPAPDWMTRGVPYLDRDERRVVPDELLSLPDQADAANAGRGGSPM